MALCLTDLAMASLGDYVSIMFVKLVKFSKENATEGFKERYIRETCKRLEERFHTIPSILADEIAAKLLYCLNKSYGDMFGSAYRQWADEVLDPLVGAVLHPSLTKLRYSEKWSHTAPKYKLWKCVLLSIDKNLHKLAKVKELEYGFYPEEHFIRTVNVSENLEHFTFTCLCTDEILKDLASRCRRLKSIDVSYSLGVTNKSVDFLLEFWNLEDLNVAGTRIGNIRDNGLTKLLVGFSRTEICNRGEAPRRTSGNLKSIGCSELTPLHVDLIVENYKYLTSLCLFYVYEYSLTGLKSLVHLKKLSLYDARNDLVEDLLLALGHQLAFLELHRMEHIQLRLIVERCPSLRCLHIGRLFLTYDYGVGDLDFLMNSDESLFPFYSSVQCIRMETTLYQDHMEYLLSKCKQLKVLHTFGCETSARRLIESVLEFNQLVHLEKYFWGYVQLGVKPEPIEGGDVILNRPTEDSVCVTVVDPLQRGKIILKSKEVKISSSP